MGDKSSENAGHARTGIFSASRNCVQILATWGRALSCCNMKWWSWMNGTTMGLRISSHLCIQNAITKMHLCSLSITYACPYHNPTATMGHTNHNVDNSKPLTHTTPYTLSAICPVQWKPGFIREENTFPKCQTAFLQSACQLHAPSKLVTSVTLCSVIKLHILECHFIVASLRHTCTKIMVSNQHLDVPHLWGGWIISAKEKCSLTQI